MKALFLATYTPDCEKDWLSWEAAGHECQVEVYDNRPHERHGEIVELARGLQPDIIAHIGAIEQYHGRPVPQPHIFQQLRDVAPTVHLCHDAADPPWWPLLQTYHDERCFNVQVSIDGSSDNPIVGFAEGMTTLTPTDSRVFKPLPWHERDIPLCMVGGMGNGLRNEIIAKLNGSGVLQFHPATGNRSYQEMAALYARSKFVFNCGVTGSTQRVHIKGRVIEAGLAGAALVEFGHSPMRDWFGEDEYFHVHSAEEVADVLASGKGEEEAARFHKSVMTYHHPKVFWDRVLNKVFDGH